MNIAMQGGKVGRLMYPYANNLCSNNLVSDWTADTLGSVCVLGW